MANENYANTRVTKKYRMAVASATAAHLQNARASEDGTVTVDQSYLAAVLKCLSAEKTVEVRKIDEEK